MSDSSTTDSTLRDTPAAPADSEHYLRAVSEMGDQRVVRAHSPIYSANGTKLVEQGVQIDSRLYERLVAHKLREPIDNQLTVDNAVDHASLRASATALLVEAPLARLLAGAVPEPQALIAPLGRVPLPGPMAFRLTLMREKHPRLYQHSVEMALVAVFLGLRSNLGQADCDALAAAALVHDIGMLHMAPAWHDPNYRLRGEERKHLAAHPITSALMVRNGKVYTPAIEIAVLEHHERHDGSGYPRGLRGAQITPLGKILLLAELASALFEKYARSQALRLSLVLRLQHRKFEPALVAHLMPLLHEQTEREAAARPWSQENVQGELLAGAVEKWSALRMLVPAAELAEASPAPARLLDSRLSALVRALTEAGSLPETQAELRESLGSDGAGLAEIDMIGREATWELQSIVNACQRRWPQLAEKATPDSGDDAVAQWCTWVEGNMPSSAPASIVSPLQ